MRYEKFSLSAALYDVRMAAEPSPRSYALQAATLYRLNQRHAVIPRSLLRGLSARRRINRRLFQLLYPLAPPAGSAAWSDEKAVSAILTLRNLGGKVSI